MAGPGEDVVRANDIYRDKKKKKSISKFLGCACMHGESLGVKDTMISLRVPDVIPSPTHDCERIKKAFHGLGKDEKTIISILGHRSTAQIRSIRETYEQLYNESLVYRLHHELSGDFRKAVIMWTRDPHERDAKLANEALKSKKKKLKKLQVLVEIACASAPHHLMAVRKAYCSLFDCSLEEDIISNAPQPLRKVLLAIVSSYRYDKELVDSTLANSDALKLNEAVESKLLDSDEILYILSTRNIYQLRTTFEFYQKNFGKPLDQDIMHCGHTDFELLLKSIIQCIQAPEKHFAEVIHTSIIGMGTDESTLTRAIVARADIDIEQIKSEYMNMYRSNLASAVSGDTSGYYKKFLMTLIGAKN